jgi:hypothetical protein
MMTRSSFTLKPIHKLINSTSKNRSFNGRGRKLLVHLFVRKVIQNDGSNCQGIHCYQLQTKPFLKDSDNGVLHLKESGFWSSPIIRFLKNATFWKLPPVLLGPLEIHSLNHRTTSVRRSKTHKRHKHLRLIFWSHYSKFCCFGRKKF